MFVCTFITTAAFFGVINDDDDDDDNVPIINHSLVTLIQNIYRTMVWYIRV